MTTPRKRPRRKADQRIVLPAWVDALAARDIFLAIDVERALMARHHAVQAGAGKRDRSMVAGHRLIERVARTRIVEGGAASAVKGVARAAKRAERFYERAWSEAIRARAVDQEVLAWLLFDARPWPLEVLRSATKANKLLLPVQRLTRAGFAASLDRLRAAGDVRRVKGMRKASLPELAGLRVEATRKRTPVFIAALARVGEMNVETDEWLRGLEHSKS